MDNLLEELKDILSNIEPLENWTDEQLNDELQPILEMENLLTEFRFNIENELQRRLDNA